MLTTLAVYNITKKLDGTRVWLKSFFSSTSYIKRRINLKKIEAISISNKGTEFVLHIPSEYDYRYSSSNKNNIIKAVVRQIFNLKDNFVKFTFYYHDQQHLKNFVQIKNANKNKNAKLSKVGYLVNNTFNFRFLNFLISSN